MVALVIALVAVASIPGSAWGAAQDAEGPGLVGAGSERHLWFVAPPIEAGRTRPGDGRAYRLYHHAYDSGGPYFQTPVPLAEAPEAMAASGAAAWLVFAASPGDDTPRRSVYSIRTERNPATEIYFYEPPRSLKIEAPLPGAGRFAGLVGRRGRPAALLVPHDWVRAGVRRADGQSRNDETLTRPRLLELRRSTWSEVDLPDFEDGEHPVGLATTGREDRFVLFVADDDGLLSGVYEQTPDGWRRTAWTARPGRLLAIASDRLVFIATRTPGEDRPLIHLLRQGELLRIGSAAFDPARSILTATDDGPALLSAVDGVFELRSIDLVNGTTGEPQALRGRPLSSATRLFLPVVLMALTVSLVLAMLLRPGGREDEQPLSGDLQPSSLGRRAGGLLIDMAPSAAVVLLATPAELIDLLRAPLWSMHLEDIYAVVLIALITAVHGAVGEALAGRSLGKAVLGMRVVLGDGRPPRLWQILLRNVFKAVTLIVPPLVIFIVLNPSRQRLGDAAARTYVVDGGPERVHDEDADRPPRPEKPD